MERQDDDGNDLGNGAANHMESGGDDDDEDDDENEDRAVIENFVKESHPRLHEPRSNLMCQWLASIKNPESIGAFLIKRTEQNDLLILSAVTFDQQAHIPQSVRNFMMTNNLNVINHVGDFKVEPK